jgi:hypothetical protein
MLSSFRNRFAPRNFEEGITLAFSFSIIFLFIAIPIFFFPRIGKYDWDQFMAFHLIQEWNFQFFGLAKEWNPFFCGGMSLAGDPQVPVLSLTMILSYVFGTLAGIKLGFIIYILFGFVGAHLFASLIVKNWIPRTLVAALFVGNGFFLTHMSHGHIGHLPAFTFPFWLWVLHRGCQKYQSISSISKRALLILTLCGTLVPIAIFCFDGSPIFPLYFFIWIMAYALWFSINQRTFIPLFILGLTFSMALIVDMVYALPMVFHSFDFPRAGQAKFQSPFCLLLYMIVPLTGTPGPSFGCNASAQEYSIYIGPVLIYLIWRYRKRLTGIFPENMGRRFLWLSLVFIILGTGSLKSLGHDWLLSPFDLLAFLPGFRSIKCTSRYWGFINLPLAFISAQALLFFLRDRKSIRKSTALLVLVFLFQLVFQAVLQITPWRESGHYRKPEGKYLYQTRSNPDAPGEDIMNQQTGHYRMVPFLAPNTGIINCYQNVEYIQGPIKQGNSMIMSIWGNLPDRSLLKESISSRWLTFSRIAIHPQFDVEALGDTREIVIVFNQNYHRHWSASHGYIEKIRSGNLALRLKGEELSESEIILQFEDPYSSLGLRITKTSLWAWLALEVILLIVYYVTAQYEKRKNSTRPSH